MTPTIIAEHLDKHFGKVHAVNDISFQVEPGEILGMLGPNGAGKTTTIRMVLDIFKPDRGNVQIFGGPITEEKKDRIGYMPEERGLYQDIPLERALIYLARLKNLSRRESRQRMQAYLERFDLVEHAHKKVKELSKGMQQKAQLIATLLHQPDLIIVDEPFSGLDPVNTQMVKDLLSELRAQGVSIVMSTHQMHHAESLCDRIMLINQGRVVLDGKLQHLQKQFSGHAIMVQSAGELPELAGVSTQMPVNGAFRWELKPDISPQQILQTLLEKQVQIERFEIAVPSLDEIFIQVVQTPQELTQ